MGKAVCSQTPSSSAIPCSRTSLVTVFLGLLDLQGGEFKERLKKKVKELRKMQREVIKLCILSLSCTKEEQKDSQAYKTKKKKQPTKTKQKPNKQKKSRDCGSLESMTGEKSRWPERWAARTQLVWRENSVGRKTGRQVSRGTSTGNFMQHGVTVFWMDSLSGDKNSGHKIFLNSTLLVNLLLCHFLFIDFASVFKTSFR